MKGIVIGAGQSHTDENVIDTLVKLKEKDDPLLKDLVILSTDRTLKYVLEQGIIPEYCGIQENLYPATRFGVIDYLKIFFECTVSTLGSILPLVSCEGVILIYFL